MKLAKLYNRIGRENKSILLLLEHLGRDPSNIDFDVINITCELMVTHNKHKECCILVEGLLSKEKASIGYLIGIFSEEKFQNSKRKNPSETTIKTMKEELPVDIIIKYSRALMCIGEKAIATEFMLSMEELDMEEYLDIFLDLVEVYSEFGLYNDALRVCKLLIDSNEVEDKSLLVLKMGILYGKVGNQELQKQYYKESLKLNPSNNQVRVRLSELYEMEGNLKVALEIMDKKDEALSNNSASKMMDKELQEVKIVDLDKNNYSEKSKNSDFLNKRSQPEQSSNDLKPITEEELKIDYQQQRLIDRQKIIGLVESIKQDEKLNEKLRQKLEIFIESQEDFFISELTKIDDTLAAFNFEQLLLDFRKCEFNFSAEDTVFWETSKECVLESLKLQVAKKDLINQLQTAILKIENQNQRNNIPDFNLSSLAGNTGIGGDQGSLFIFKRKKLKKEQKFDTIFKDAKMTSKVAQIMSEKVVEKMSTVIDEIGLEKYASVVEKALKVSYKMKNFGYLTEVCEKMLKLKKEFCTQISLVAAYQISGFLCNFYTNNYERAYIFFKFFAKTILGINQETGLKEHLLSFFPDLETKNIETLCFSIIQIIFSGFKQTATHRSFFVKFKDQFGNENTKDFVKHISTNLYLSSGSYDLAKQNIISSYDPKKENPLYDFLLGFSHIMEGTNRTNKRKTESIEKGFNFLKKYEMQTSNNSEVLYNLGRAFSHVNQPDLAIEMFKKSRRITEGKILEINAECLDNHDNLNERLTLFERIKNSGRYTEGVMNELVWHRKLGNVEMEKYLIENYLTIDEF